MFNVISFVTLALAATSVSARVVPRKTAPAGWLTDVLENYQTYHTRYLALNCQSAHGKPFFDLCCHPMLAKETLAKNRDASCVPSAAASVSASAAEPTSTVTTYDDGDDEEDCSADEDEDEDCEEEETDASVVVPSSSSYTPPAPSSTKAVAEAVAAEPTSSKVTPTYTKVEPTSIKAEPTSTKAEPTTIKAEPTTTKAEPTTTKAAEATPAAAAPASSGGDVITGHATFYEQNGVAGACGNVHGEYDMIIAIGFSRYGDTGKKSPDCGRRVEITNTKNGKKVQAVVEDACESCGDNSIDLSRGAFTTIATEAEGLVPITWKFL